VGHLPGDLMSALGLLRSAAQVRAAPRRRAVYVDLLHWPDEGNIRAWRAGMRTGRPGQAWHQPVTQPPGVGEAPAVSGIPRRNGGRGQPADMQLGLEHPGAGS
jgi:hypothetical protein